MDIGDYPGESGQPVQVRWGALLRLMEGQKRGDQRRITDDCCSYHDIN